MQRAGVDRAIAHSIDGFRGWLATSHGVALLRWHCKRRQLWGVPPVRLRGQST